MTYFIRTKKINKISFYQLKIKHLFVDKILKYDLERPFRFQFFMDLQCYTHTHIYVCVCVCVCVCEAGIHFVFSNSSCHLEISVFMFVGIKGSINTWRKDYGEQMLRALRVLAACNVSFNPLPS